jgi:hypothetical protein
VPDDVVVVRVLPVLYERDVVVLEPERVLVVRDEPAPPFFVVVRVNQPITMP